MILLPLQGTWKELLQGMNNCEASTSHDFGERSSCSRHHVIRVIFPEISCLNSFVFTSAFFSLIRSVSCTVFTFCKHKIASVKLQA